MSVNGWIDGKVLAVLQAFGVELPGGDGDTLRSMAAAWKRMGTELTAIGTAIDTAAAGIAPEQWSGDAHTAFTLHWGDQKKVIDAIAGNFAKVAAGLDAFATEIDSINESIIDICVQIAEMEVAGAVLSIFTGFLSDLVANTAVAAKVAKIIDLVKLFSTAADKVGELLEEFFELSEESAATLKAVLSTVADLSADFLKDGAEAFVTNFVADTGSTMASQALSGQSVNVGADTTTGIEDAGGTALFTAGGSALADRAGISGGFGNFLRGDGLLGTSLNGAAGNVVGGVTADMLNNKSGSTTLQDALTNAATGAVGNAGNHLRNGQLEAQGSLGGENLSDRAKLADAAYKNSIGTALNGAVYTAGSGIETDIQNLADAQGQAANP